MMTVGSGVGVIATAIIAATATTGATIETVVATVITVTTSIRTLSIEDTNKVYILALATVKEDKAITRKGLATLRVAIKDTTPATAEIEDNTNSTIAMDSCEDIVRVFSGTVMTTAVAVATVRGFRFRGNRITS
jgi:hypothetical protein